jgi:transposase-like protein
MSPIRIEQTTLIKFFPILRRRRITRLGGDGQKLPIDENYTLILEPNGNLKIRETHCLKCGSRLVKNGWNSRILILDKEFGKKQVRLKRKRCPKCGEVESNLTEYVPRYSNYHENFRRRARQHYMEGLMPSQIKRVFKIDFGIEVSKTSIVNWINEAAEPLREMLKETPVPSSGHWGYDEIHMRISGERMYTLDAVDVVTKFIPAAKISESMGRQAGLYFFKEARHNNKLWINSIVKDCTTNLGGLFRTHSFKHIIQQNCLTHVKWVISKHVKAFAGLSTASTKPVPKKWRWLLKRFYDLLDSKDETDAYIKLEILRDIVMQLKGKKINHLYIALKNLISWFPKIMAHQRNPSIPTTNNLLEAYHKKFNYYPSFKRNMMTPQGAQRVLDYRVFRHNLHRFSLHITRFKHKYERFRENVRNSSKPNMYGGYAKYYKYESKRLDNWYGNYRQLWEEYFALQKE